MVRRRLLAASSHVSGLSSAIIISMIAGAVQQMSNKSKKSTGLLLKKTGAGFCRDVLFDTELLGGNEIHIAEELHGHLNFRFRNGGRIQDHAGFGVVLGVG